MSHAGALRGRLWSTALSCSPSPLEKLIITLDGDVNNAGLPGKIWKNLTENFLSVLQRVYGEHEAYNALDIKVDCFYLYNTPLKQTHSFCATFIQLLCHLCFSILSVFGTLNGHSEDPKSGRTTIAAFEMSRSMIIGWTNCAVNSPGNGMVFSIEISN